MKKYCVLIGVALMVVIFASGDLFGQLTRYHDIKVTRSMGAPSGGSVGKFPRITHNEMQNQYCIENSVSATGIGQRAYINILDPNLTTVLFSRNYQVFNSAGVELTFFPSDITYNNIDNVYAIVGKINDTTNYSYGLLIINNIGNFVSFNIINIPVYTYNKCDPYDMNIKAINNNYFIGFANIVDRINLSDPANNWRRLFNEADNVKIKDITTYNDGGADHIIAVGYHNLVAPTSGARVLYYNFSPTGVTYYLKYYTPSSTTLLYLMDFPRSVSCIYAPTATDVPPIYIAFNASPNNMTINNKMHILKINSTNPLIFQCVNYDMNYTGILRDRYVTDIIYKDSYLYTTGATSAAAQLFIAKISLDLLTTAVVRTFDTSRVENANELFINYATNYVSTIGLSDTLTMTSRRSGSFISDAQNLIPNCNQTYLNYLTNTLAMLPFTPKVIAGIPNVKKAPGKQFDYPFEVILSCSADGERGGIITPRATFGDDISSDEINVVDNEIVLNPTFANATYSIFNIQGEAVKTGTVDDATINTAVLNTGTYFIVLTKSDMTVYNKKFIVIR